MPNPCVTLESRNIMDLTEDMRKQLMELSGVTDAHELDAMIEKANASGYGPKSKSKSVSPFQGKEKSNALQH